MSLLKLDGVGPIDNRPSTDKLHHFVRKKEEKKNLQKLKNVLQKKFPEWFGH